VTIVVLTLSCASQYFVTFRDSLGPRAD